MGNSNSSGSSISPETIDKKKKQSSTTRKPPLPPPKPKHILWGCSTAEEHHEAVKQACHMASDQHGLEGLMRLGFEFRMVHSDPCTCQINQDIDVESLSDDENDGNNNDGDDDNDENDEFFDNDDDDSRDVVVSPDVGEDSKENSSLGDDDMEQEKVSQMFMVPVGTKINDLEIKKKSSTNNFSPASSFGGGSVEGGVDDRSEFPATTGSRRMSRAQSSMSLFSLATHHSMSSSEASFVQIQNNGDNNSNNNNQQRQQRPIVQIHGHSHDLSRDSSCSLRLFHIESDTMITEKIHQTYIAHGQMYDEVARLCMEYAQDLMIKTGNLKWVNVCPKRNFRALVSRHDDDGDDNNDDNDENSNNNHQETATTSPPEKVTDNNNIRRRRRPTLVIITGKGKVGAGIFSRRFCMTLGMEPATALPFVQEAVYRDMDVILLDPNNCCKEGCPEKLNAMEVVEASLEQLCFLQKSNNSDNRSGDIDDDTNNDDEGIYVLAHSMAGSQLVRYLLGKANNHPSLREEDGSQHSHSHHDHSVLAATNGCDEETTTAVETYLGQIKAVAFTDSNHNINWVKKYPSLTDFFTCNKSLYIKSHKVHEDAKALGQVHHDCHYWRHRFGNIKTLWAGTNEHALTNHTARFHIWDHFDAFR